MTPWGSTSPSSGWTGSGSWSWPGTTSTRLPWSIVPLKLILYFVGSRKLSFVWNWVSTEVLTWKSSTKYRNYSWRRKIQTVTKFRRPCRRVLFCFSFIQAWNSVNFIKLRCSHDPPFRAQLWLWSFGLDWSSSWTHSCWSMGRNLHLKFWPWLFCCRIYNGSYSAKKVQKVSKENKAKILKNINRRNKLDISRRMFNNLHIFILHKISILICS